MNFGRNLDSFFKRQSILKTFRFVVALDDYNGNTALTNHRTSRKGSTANLFDIFQVVDVDIPTYSFNRQAISINNALQFSYPVMTEQQQLDVRITLTENVYGDIQKLIKILESTVVDNGVHKYIKDMFLGDLTIELYDDYAGGRRISAQPVSRWSCKKVFFLGSEKVSLSYSSNDAVTYVLNFGTDNIEYEDVKPPMKTNIR